MGNWSRIQADSSLMGMGRLEARAEGQQNEVCTAMLLGNLLAIQV